MCSVGVEEELPVVVFVAVNEAHFEVGVQLWIVEGLAVQFVEFAGG